MTDPAVQRIEHLCIAYDAFNARDIDAALAVMTQNVAWPRAFKGGHVKGANAVRAYWTEQWSEISPHVEPVGFHPSGPDSIQVDVHQVVRDLSGKVMADEQVAHHFTFKGALIQAMDIG